MKKIILSSLFSTATFFAHSQDSIAHRFMIGVQPSLEWTNFKPENSQVYRRPDILEGGLGLGGIVETLSIGLVAGYEWKPKIFFTSGIFFARIAGRIESEKAIMVYQSGNALVPISQIDSSYLRLHPGTNKCLFDSRTYGSNYAVVPMLVNFRIVKYDIYSFTFIVGGELQFRTETDFEDYYYKYSDSTEIFVTLGDAVTRNEMNSTLFTLYAGMENRIELGKHFVFAFGSHWTHGLSNPVKKYSIYNMDEGATESNFLTNGKPVAIEQKFHLKTFGLHVGFYFQF
ncbi:MAG: hypothetical protein HY064_05935 [Bacteroidetes bacterium]|nr:hypothetical protein [Bacteroidota bacterium]